MWRVLDMWPVFCTGHLSRAGEAREMTRKVMCSQPPSYHATEARSRQREEPATHTQRTPSLRHCAHKSEPNLPKNCPAHQTQDLVRRRCSGPSHISKRANGKRPKKKKDFSLCWSFIHNSQQPIKNPCFPRRLGENRSTTTREKAQHRVALYFSTAGLGTCVSLVAQW